MVKQDFKSSENKNYVAVYGTLRRGFHNHKILEYFGAEYLGRAKTVEKYPMVIKHGIPYVGQMKRNEMGSEIVVEIYRISDECLKQLDRLEGCPDWYHREEVRLEGFEKVNQLGIHIEMYFSHEIDKMSDEDLKNVVEESGDFERWLWESSLSYEE